MINTKSIQTDYQHFYEAMRNYIWPFNIVSKLADIEIACYQAFPDVENIEKLLKDIKKDIGDVLKDDKDMKKAFDALLDTVTNAKDVYLDLVKVTEVVRNENN